MRARKGRSAEATDVGRRPPEEGENEFGETEADEDGGTGFFACYLLASLSPRHKGRTYIGFTVNPRRRIRQHNGEIRCGAWRTKNGRPWEMVLCIYGFPSNVCALQFEWAWQHPRESLAVRKAASSFKSLSGIANKIKLAYTMLLLPPWESLNLTVNFFSTKHMKHTAGCPKLPKQMKTILCIMDELPCYVKGSICDDNTEEEAEDIVVDDINEKEGSNSPCLDVLADHVEEEANHVHTTARGSPDIWSKHGDFLTELESSPRFMESSNVTKDSAFHEVGVTNSAGKIFPDDLNIWEDIGGTRKPMETTESCCLIELPKPGQEDSCASSTGTTRVSCSDEPFDFVAEVGLESSRQWTPRSNHKKVSTASSGEAFDFVAEVGLERSRQWTPRSSNKKASTDSLLLSPEKSVIDLVSPPSFLVGSRQWTPRSSSKKASTDSLLLSPKNNVINLVSPPSFVVGFCKNNKNKMIPVHNDVIDLTDSPIRL